MRWRRKRMNLAERLRPYVEQHRVLSEPMVDADPIRMFLLRWIIETGDPIDVVAKGFDVDLQLLIEILERRTKQLPGATAVELRECLGLDEPGNDCGRPLNLDASGAVEILRAR